MFERLIFPYPIDKTEKLFHQDPYQRTSKATVIYLDKEYFVLDKTIFYAESGGQDFDTGIISGMQIVDVQDQGGRVITSGTLHEIPTVKVDTVIVHKYIGTPSFAVGDEVDLAIDWDRRYSLMRNHSASHFLYYAAERVLKEKTGEMLFTKGCHIKTDGARFDFANDFPAEWLPEIEELANSLILSGENIQMTPEPITNEVYYWTFADQIRIPCGGTHVKSAQELKPISVKRKKQGAGNTRLKFDMQYG